ncbi:glycogen debranching N-terminal domain-containing protein [Halomicroarcula sp. GCM10025709]|uniref:glycogen debranching N-terminal domain-containing protein n=1 Tax=Halomicroarcula sp. GCM10025709 TaxID=3252669 RepID=UPI003606FE7F
MKLSREGEQMTQETLVDGYTYLVFPTATHADITAGDTGGLYDRDTRYLSELSCDVATGTLTRLQSTLVSPRSRTETFVPAATGVNTMTGTGEVAKHTDRSFTRRLSVTEGHGAVQTITVRNHSPDPESVELRLGFEADFADVFEVRGFEADINRTVETRIAEDTVHKSYSFTHGDADTRYATTVAFDPAPTSLTDDEARFSLGVEPRDTATVTTRIGLDDALPSAETASGDTDRVDIPAVPTADDELAGVVEQAAADLRALTTDTEYGRVPLAGTPWFAAPFGRDALITAYQALPVAPELAAGTLRYLAAHQGQRTDDRREEEPGKIFHEQRQGSSRLADSCHTRRTTARSTRRRCGSSCWPRPATGGGPRRWPPTSPSRCGRPSTGCTRRVRRGPTTRFSTTRPPAPPWHTGPGRTRPQASGSPTGRPPTGPSPSRRYRATPQPLSGAGVRSWAGSPVTRLPPTYRRTGAWSTATGPAPSNGASTTSSGSPTARSTASRRPARAISSTR